MNYLTKTLCFPLAPQTTHISIYICPYPLLRYALFSCVQWQVTYTHVQKFKITYVLQCKGKLVSVQYD